MNSYRLIESAWMLSIITVIVLILWALTGCATTPACVKPIVSIERPVLPTVPATDLQCLSDGAYVRLAERDILLHQTLERCELIVRELAEVPF